MADGAGHPQPEVLLTLRRDGLVVAQMRTDLDGMYRFAHLPAGAYSLDAAGMGVVKSSIVLDGQQEYSTDILWVVPGSRSTLQGRLFASDGAAVPSMLVRLLRAGAEIAHLQTDSSGDFRFAGLPGGIYALAVGVDALLVVDVQVAEDATVTRDLTLPAASDKLVARYLLFPHATAGISSNVEQRLALSLAIDYLLRAGVSGGFSVDEAAHAAHVTIVGDSVPASVDGILRAAGCQVVRLSGDGLALAETFARLLVPVGEG